MKNKAPLPTFHYSNADWDTLNQAVSEVNWNTALGEECTIKVHNFLTIVGHVCRSNLPIKKFKTKSKCIARERKILMRTRTMQ